MLTLERHSINSIYFIDLNDRKAHIPNIEGLWSRSKYLIINRRELSIKIQLDSSIQLLLENSNPRIPRFNNWLIFTFLKFILTFILFKTRL